MKNYFTFTNKENDPNAYTTKVILLVLIQILINKQLVTQSDLDAFITAMSQVVNSQIPITPPIITLPSTENPPRNIDEKP